MTTAFVLSGGAAHGATQVGMLLALSEAGMRPDLIVGTSVGAVNGAWLAGGSEPDDIAALASVWRQLRREDIFPTRPLLGLMGFLGRRPNLVPDTGLRRLLTNNLRFTRLEDAPIPLHVIATDVLDGHDARLSAGDVVPAVLASAAIPVVFPPVRINGRDYLDGGLVNNTPISHAVALGADTVWVLSTGYACALTKPPRGALNMAVHALSLAVNQRLAVDVERYETTVDLRVIPVLCPIHTSPSDFRHAAQLIDRTQASTRQWLASTTPTTGQAALFARHRH